MPQVQTARGTVDTAELGQTLMHEHVFVLTADVQQNYPAEWGSEEDRVADAVQRLTSLHALGVRTIVDPKIGDVSLRVRLTDDGGDSVLVEPAGGTTLPALPHGDRWVTGKYWAQTVRVEVTDLDDPDFDPGDGAEVFSSLQAALDGAAGHDAFVIGGGRTYEQALPLADRILITEIDAEPRADTFFPAPDPGDWREVSREERIAADGTRFAWVDLRRRGTPQPPGL